MKNVYKLVITIMLLTMPGVMWGVLRDVSVNEAYYRILNQIGSDDNVYYFRDTNRHVFFVDEDPLKGWEHNCKYFWVATQVEIPQNPTIESESATYPKYDLNFSPYMINTTVPSATIDVRNAIVPNDFINSAGDTYAIILSGGINKNSNYVRYWNDCSFIYQTLRRRFHIEKDHISVLMSDGTNPAVDMKNLTGNYVSSPLDLDCDGVADINMSATRSNLISELQRLANIMSSDDKLFFYVIDHGGTTDYNDSSYICLWNSERIYDYELAYYLDAFNVSSMNIVMGQCFSGGFINDLAASNRVITTACTGSQRSRGCYDKPFDEFVYHWTTAVNERDVYGNSVTTDTDDNGQVTMSEAFSYAQSNDVYSSETPQISSYPIKNNLALNDVPFTYILMLRDNLDDVGEEPNTTTTSTYLSPDIWIRNQDDGLTNQETERIYVTDFTNPVFHAYYRIKNIGEKDYVYSIQNKQRIHSFWAEASTGFLIDTWLGNDNDGSIDQGNILYVENITETIPAGESRIVHRTYGVPQGILDRLLLYPNDQFHICYLTCIDPSGNNIINLPGRSYNPNLVDILGYRNIAQINAFFASPEEASTGLSLIMRNVYDDDHEYTLEVLPAREYPTNIAKTEITLRLSEPLYESWKSNGSFSKSMFSFSSSPQTLYCREFGSKIENITLRKGQSGRFLCSCNIVANEDVHEETTYAYDIIMRDKKSGAIIDGERFVIRQKPRKAILPEIEVISTDMGYVLKAGNVYEEAVYSWYDGEGNKVGEGQEIRVTPTKRNCQYRLQVKAKSDSSVNYANISLEPTLSIRNVSPNPFLSQTTITLNAPATENTVVKLTSATGTDFSTSYPIQKGEKEITINTSHLDKGVYVLTLLNNGIVIDFQQVIHE